MGENEGLSGFFRHFDLVGLLGVQGKSQNHCGLGVRYKMQLWSLSSCVPGGDLHDATKHMRALVAEALCARSQALHMVSK